MVNRSSITERKHHSLRLRFLDEYIARKVAMPEVVVHIAAVAVAVAVAAAHQSWDSEAQNDIDDPADVAIVLHIAVVRSLVLAYIGVQLGAH